LDLSRISIPKGYFPSIRLYTTTPSDLWGKSEVTLPQMLPPEGSISMGVDQRNHVFAPGLSPGWITTPSDVWEGLGIGR